MNRLRRTRINNNRKAIKPSISKAAKSLLEAYGVLNIPDGLIGSGSNGNIIKKDAVEWLAQATEAEEEE